MACPHYLRAESRCQLLDCLVTSCDDDEEELTPGEGVRVSLCRGEAAAYGQCPVYRQHVAEQRSAQ